ncbi:MAG: NUDIX domain-containing protein [Clostridiales bacterium]|jgi:tRNA nucleotidyltransferase (CCA-adding enzyme)|nr:NUDIX domain-containing protein [Clostridiales bacterium]
MKLEKSCGAIVYRRINNNIEFLAIKSNSPGGHWGFPKGHVEEGETEEETSIREVYEETGLIIKLCKGFREYDKYQVSENTYKEVIFFIADAMDQNVVINEDEVVEYRWASFDEIYDILTYDSSKNILKKAKEFVERQC